jgi:DnaK suppressor protein
VSKTPAPRAASAKAVSTKAASPSKAKPASSVSSKPPAQAATKPAAKPVATAAKTVAPASKAAPAKTPAKTPIKAAAKSVPPAPVKAPVVAKVVVIPAPSPAPTRKSGATKKPLATPPAPISLHVRDLPPAAPSRPLPVNLIEDHKVRRKVDPKLANVWKQKAGRDLNEDELQAMPDDEYMNDKQLEFFRAMLMRQRDDLLSNAGETTEHLREDTTIVPDPADRATIEEEHALELRTRDRERKLLKKISQSIARIDAGDYGYCDETGEPIGLGRLLARPTATLSLEAQQRRELKQKMFGD